MGFRFDLGEGDSFHVWGESIAGLAFNFADGIHRSYGPKLASTIKITVAEGPGPAATAAAKEATKEASDHKQHKH